MLKFFEHTKHGVNPPPIYLKGHDQGFLNLKAWELKKRVLGDLQFLGGTRRYFDKNFFSLSKFQTEIFSSSGRRIFLITMW